jgi:carotenoid cleavage dioxygenase-like enzyme
MLRTLSICYLSSLSRLSVANTLLIFHDRKLLATCESGPMMRVQAPGLETKGWELFIDEHGEGLGVGKQVVGKKLGKKGQMLEEWTTGHPKVCPVTGDMVFYGYNM